MFKFQLNKDDKRSAAWAQQLIDEDTYTYGDCVEYRLVMDHHVKSMMKRGDSKGFPIIDAKEGNVPPDGTAVYDATTAITTFKPHMTKPHEEMTFLRAAPLLNAIEYVRNEGQPPVQVDSV